MKKPMLNKSLLIICLLMMSNIVFPFDRFDPVPLNDTGLTLEEYTERKKLLLNLQKDISNILKRKKTFSSVRDYLKDDFYYSSNYLKILPDDNACCFIPNEGVLCNSRTKDFLIKLDNHINISNLIYVFDHGRINAGSRVATSYLPRSDPHKYPYIDYYYDIEGKKWQIGAIRYLKLID